MAKTAEERRDRTAEKEYRREGRGLRARAPRSSHGSWTPAKNRDPIAILEQQATQRDPSLIPIRHGRMASSAFAFFRGGAAIMAADLAGTPTTGLTVQTCGDAHVANFGKFATPERRIVFDINDFDETLPGPWEWDVKRLCASLHIALRERGFSRKQCDHSVWIAVQTYGEELDRYAKMRTLPLWYDRIRLKQAIAHFPPELRPEIKKDAKRAKTKVQQRAVAKLTRIVKGKTTFIDNPPLQKHLPRTGPAIDEVMTTVEHYRKTLNDERRLLFDRFEIIDVATKVVGVGSVGTSCWMALFEASAHPGTDQMVLQIKEAQASVLEPYVGNSHHPEHGQRVVSGQRLIQGSSDIFLGWCTGRTSKREYYVRQLWDVKGQGDLTRMSLNALVYYGALCAWALARAHARTGDAARIAGYLGGGKTFGQAMVKFAAAYADNNERDFEAIKAAIKSGRIDSRPDPKLRN
jgi:uncharacterized protein (DUF2252 family)